MWTISVQSTFFSMIGQNSIQKPKVQRVKRVKRKVSFQKVEAREARGDNHAGRLRNEEKLYDKYTWDRASTAGLFSEVLLLWANASVVECCYRSSIAQKKHLHVLVNFPLDCWVLVQDFKVFT